MTDIKIDDNFDFVFNNDGDLILINEDDLKLQDLKVLLCISPTQNKQFPLLGINIIGSINGATQELTNTIITQGKLNSLPITSVFIDNENKLNINMETQILSFKL
jgi:hypothetical protein